MEIGGTNALKLLADLFRRPITTVNRVADHLDVSFPTANRLVARFEDAGFLREVTGQKRSRMFRYEPYLRLFEEPGEGPESDPAEVTAG